MTRLKTTTLLYVIFAIILKSRSQMSIQNVFFLNGTNIMTSDSVQRDGIVIVTLNTNENTSICNYRFDDADANVVCRTLGFPPQGLSIINNQYKYFGPVLLANFQCTGSESSLGYCSNSGRSVQGPPCSNHVMDAHVYCLFPKVPLVVSPTVVNTICTKTSPNYVFTPQPGKTNIGLVQARVSTTNYFICNDDFSFTPDAANYVCNQICNNPSNPSLVMPYSDPSITNATTTTSVRLSCGSPTSCVTSSPINCFRKASFVGVKCGEEPQIIEKSPNISCTTVNMTLTWSFGFQPPINPALITLTQDCNDVELNNITGDAVMVIPFSSCPPTQTGDNNFLNFSYVVNRAYVSTGFVTQVPKLVPVVCSFPRPGNPNNSFEFGQITNSPLNGTTMFEFQMRFYADTGYVTEILPNGLVNSDKQLYVKVNIVNPSKDVSLSLSQCYGANINDINSLNAANSVSLITNVCPVALYNVVISQFSRSEVRFSFTPFKLTSNATQRIYVLCRTSLCYLNTDSNCPVCGNGRRKRSVAQDIKEYVVGGSLLLYV